MIKLVAFDMDGTLLDSQKRLPKRFPQLVKALKKLGIKLAIASGRQYAKIAEVMADYLDDFIYISDNGAIIHHQGQLLQALVMDKSLAIQLLDLIDQNMNLFTLVSSDTQAHLKQADFDRYWSLVNTYCSRYKIVNDLREADNFVKITLYADDDRCEGFEIFAPFKEQVSVTQSGDNWVDISDNRCNNAHVR